MNCDIFCCKNWLATAKLFQKSIYHFQLLFDDEEDGHKQYCTQQQIALFSNCYFDWNANINHSIENNLPSWTIIMYFLPPPSYQHNFPILSIISKGYSKASPLGSDCWKPRWGCNPVLRWPSRPINSVFRGSYLTIVLRSKGKIPNLCASYKWSPLKSYKRPSH